MKIQSNLVQTVDEISFSINNLDTELVKEGNDDFDLVLPAHIGKHPWQDMSSILNKFYSLLDVCNSFFYILRFGTSHWLGLKHNSAFRFMNILQLHQPRPHWTRCWEVFYAEIRWNIYHYSLYIGKFTTIHLLNMAE